MAPTNLIIFGFTGDLVRRKLLPSLYHLELDGLIDENIRIIATTRREVDLNNLKDELYGELCSIDGSCSREHLDSLFDRLELVDMDITKQNDYQNLVDVVHRHDGGLCRNRIFYFAVPPTLFEEVINNLVASSLHICDENEVTRLLIEKPFGSNLSSAQGLLDTINKTFGNEHIYHIDHYLAKETVQNILHFRFHNPMFSSLLNAQQVACIQVSALESIDVQGRTNFYEETGALRDMIQSHLLQIMALVTMEEPERLDAASIRRSRQNLLQSVERLEPGKFDELSARGQYEGYRDEVGQPNSNVETFAALRLGINTDRWRNVPIFLRAGKALDQKLTEITITFKDRQGKPSADNVLTLRIQPNEGIAIQLKTKKPGLADESKSISLDYCYVDDEMSAIHDAYEKILLDAINGDQTLFTTDEEIISNWQLVDPLLRHWSESSDSLEVYTKGSAGPRLADDLVAREGLRWVNLPNICIPRFK